jgi:hypothetical protein
VVFLSARKSADDRFPSDLFGTTDDLKLSADQVLRLVCHVLVERLAACGLPEAVESLREMVAFHDRVPLQPKALPQATPVQVRMRYAGTVTATLPPVIEPE